MIRKNIILLFGGMSDEHEISIISSRSVFANYDKELYKIFNVGVSLQTGQFYYFEGSSFPDIKTVDDSSVSGKKLVYLRKNNLGRSVVAFDDFGASILIDCVFNLIHGSYGEDGKIQGFLDVLGFKYVGCNVLTSAISMHKTYSKIIAKHFGIDTAKFLNFSKNSILSFKVLSNELGLPFFLKNDGAGSSKGVYKIKTQIDYEEALKTLFEISDTCIAEEGLNVREIELSVFSDKNGVVKIADKIGEVVVKGNHEFYTYECKYFDEDGADLITNAQFEDGQIREKLYDLSKKIFNFFECKGMTRVDFFIERDGQKRILFNELTTLPGFTKISMYPTLWIESGVSYKQLITNLIESAL